MKLNMTSLLVGIIASFGGVCDANAWMVNCPEGCFCLNNGKYNNSSYDYADVQDIYCATPSQLVQSCFGSGWIFYGTDIGCNHSPGANYQFEQFSELYQGFFGFYGVLHGQVIYMPFDPLTQSMYSCPANYPQSDPGAKSVYECYSYGPHGSKVYYSIAPTSSTSASTGSTGGSGTSGSMSGGGHGGTTSTTVTCAEGTYLPANAQECEPCSAAKHHICPGGTFSIRNNKKIKGLMVECYPGEYLPRGAIQCSPCESEHLCVGGIYNVDGLESVGSVGNNGYIYNGNHTVKVCNPGYYMPGDSQNCVACSGNYACPGGVFYTSGGPYQSSRGRIYCAYGQANDTHTECISTSTSPSSAGQLQQNVSANAQQPQPEMSGKPQLQTTGHQVLKPAGNGNKRMSTLKAAQQKQPVKTGKQTQTTQPTDTTESETEITEQQKKLEFAKKLISAGVATSVMNE